MSRAFSTGHHPLGTDLRMAVVADADDVARLERCNDFTLQLNIAKVGIANGNLIVTADHVVTESADLSTLFQLTVNLLMQVVSAWFGSWDQGRHEAPGSEDNDG